MPPIHPSGLATALYRVFVAPTLTKTRPTPLRTPQQSRPPPRTSNPTAFTTTTYRPAKTRAPEQRAHRWNDEIKGTHIYLVNQQTNSLSDLRSLRAVLANLNKDTHRLVQVAEQPAPDDPDGAVRYPVCKIEDKKQVYQREKNAKLAQKEGKKASALASSVKTVELNWAIDGNDLGHRLERMREFLAEGRKVEVVLAAKKAGRKASVQECEEVMRKVRGVVESVPGAREAKPLEGTLGKFCTVLFQGKGQEKGGGKAGKQKAQAAAADG